jgi:hypothetical protein
LQTQTLPKILFIYENLFGSIENEIATKEENAKILEQKYQLLLCYAQEGKFITNKSNEFVNKLIEKSQTRNDSKLNVKPKNRNNIFTPDFVNTQLDTTSNDETDFSNIYRQIVKKLHPDVAGNNPSLRSC